MTGSIYESLHMAGISPHMTGYANLVRRHLCEKMLTFCQNSNKSTTNHTFLQQIDHIEGGKLINSQFNSTQLN